VLKADAARKVGGGTLRATTHSFDPSPSNCAATRIRPPAPNWLPCRPESSRLRRANLRADISETGATSPRRSRQATLQRLNSPPYRRPGSGHSA
jgi:hypothetical protein